MRKETHMTYEQAFEYVGSFTKSGTPVKDLIRFVILMRLLGNPQNELKIVHVAGTNGKGSVCEYISNAVKADNKSVGKFTSPYIECIEERIQVNGKYISRPAFALLCEQVKKAVEQTGFDGFSQFEILCAITLLYFYKEQVNVAVIETGIGGLRPYRCAWRYACRNSTSQGRHNKAVRSVHSISGTGKRGNACH